MADIKKKWDMLTKEKRDSVIREVIAYFQSERDEEIGVIAAEEILDFFLQEIAEDIYNKAINDSRNVIRQGLESMEIDLDILRNK